MCGICGFAAVSPESQLDRSRLLLMRDTLTHRGPDGAGAYFDSSAALAHQRLAIVDLASGAQPMHNEDRSVWISFNGEIYNHRELRALLEARGHIYSTSSDTESILHLYEEFGVGAVDYLRGMFAFAIWDRKHRTLLLARDRLGIKPLYYHISEDGSIYFASEIKALVQAGVVKPRLNYDALPDYVANRSTSGEETLFDGIKKLLPAQTLLWKNGSVRIRRYWEPSFAKRSEDELATESRLIEQFGALFDEAVDSHLMADVPLGVFLSGGIDSSAIVSSMTRLGVERVKTFSVAFAEREANELHYARLVARAFGTEHREVTVGADDFFSALPKLVYQEDEPLAHPSSVPLHFVSMLAASEVKVVLTGEGSDELLAGYDKYRKTVYNLALGRVYGRIAPDKVRSVVRWALKRSFIPSAPRQKLSRTFLALPVDLENIYFDNFAVFPRSMQERLFTPEVHGRISGRNPHQHSLDTIARSDASCVLDTLLASDLETYLPELLMKQDQMSMSASVESRVPFLDHKLVEFATSLSSHMKLRGLTTKYILRRAMKGRLPDEILSRRKMGFPVPLGNWLRGPYSGILDEYVLGPRARRRGIFAPLFARELVARHRAGENHTERLWTLINFEIWQRQFVDGESTGDRAPLDRRSAMSRRLAG